MSINILEHNPYIDVLQVKAAHVKEYDEFKEIAMVLDYTESKQMAATISGTAEISGDKDLPTKDQIKKEMKEEPQDESPLDVMRRMAEEEGFDFGSGDEDDEDDEDDGDLSVI